MALSNGLRPINPHCRCPLCQKNKKVRAPTLPHAARAVLDDGLHDEALDVAVRKFRSVRLDSRSTDHGAVIAAIRAYLEACAG